jgi:hypothetical protein
VTIPAETTGAGKEVVITAVWYAEDLRINVPVKHSDPRSGSVTLTVTQVSRTQPEPAFFEVPEGYKQRGRQSPAQ